MRCFILVQRADELIAMESHVNNLIIENGQFLHSRPLMWVYGQMHRKDLAIAAWKMSSQQVNTKDSWPSSKIWCMKHWAFPFSRLIHKLTLDLFMIRDFLGLVVSINSEPRSINEVIKYKQHERPLAVCPADAHPVSSASARDAGWRQAPAVKKTPVCIKTKHLNDSSSWIMQIIACYCQETYARATCKCALLVHCVGTLSHLSLEIGFRLQTLDYTEKSATLPGSWLPSFVEQSQFKHMKGCTSALKRKLIMFVHDCLLLTLVSIIEDTAGDMQSFKYRQRYIDR